MNFNFNYKPSPTFLQFHRDGTDIRCMKFNDETGELLDPGKNYVRCVMGPVGSGKTVGCVAELFFQVITQWKNPLDNTRRSRIAIVRDTYKNLDQTTLKTFLHWFPEGVISEVRKSPPITITWKFDLAEDDHVEAEFLCVALDGPNALEDLKSNEFSGAFINECSACDKEVVNMLVNRMGRYPGGNIDPEGHSKSFVIADTNPPSLGNWYQVYKDETHPRGWKFYDQPPALLYDYDAVNNKYNFYPNTGQRKGIPKAENIKYLKEGFGYYMKTVDTADPSYTLVFHCMQYGEVGNGTAVYTTYSDKVHCATEDIPFDRSLPLILGFDYGLTPACLFAQYSPFGQLRFIDELFKEGVGMEYFFDTYLLPKLINEYDFLRGIPIIAVGDPSGVKRADTDERSCEGMLLERNIPIEGCTTNALIPRLESMRYFLNSMASGKPAFQVSPKCKDFRLGLQGLYRFKPMRGSDILREEPAKDRWSHLQDCGQYIAHRIRFSREYEGASLFGSYGMGYRAEQRIENNATYGKCSTVLV